MGVVTRSHFDDPVKHGELLHDGNFKPCFGIGRGMASSERKTSGIQGARRPQLCGFHLKFLGLHTGKRCRAHQIHAIFPHGKSPENINEIRL